MQVTLLHLRRNAVAYLALFVALGGTSFAAATMITGKNVKDSSLTGADVRMGSLTGSDVKNNSLGGSDIGTGAVNGDDVANGSLLALDFASGQLPQGPKGDTGPQGPKGDTGLKGDTGADGTDATINGVAAGGALTGTYPNPGIADDAITTAKLAPGMQEATLLDVPRGTPLDSPGTIGPFTGPIRFKANCLSTFGLAVLVQHSANGAGEFHGTYVRGASTVKRTDQVGIASFVNGVVVSTNSDVGSPGNDSGTGSFIYNVDGSTVFAAFTYLADDTHCRLLGAMHLMQ